MIAILIIIIIFIYLYNKKLDRFQDITNTTKMPIINDANPRVNSLREARFRSEFNIQSKDLNRYLEKSNQFYNLYDNINYKKALLDSNELYNQEKKLLNILIKDMYDPKKILSDTQNNQMLTTNPSPGTTTTYLGTTTTPSGTTTTPSGTTTTSSGTTTTSSGITTTSSGTTNTPSGTTTTSSGITDPSMR